MFSPVHLRLSPHGQRRERPAKAAWNARGYSLVELLIVVAIILAILGLALPRLTAARHSAEQAAAVVFLRNLQTAQQQYLLAHGEHAASFAQLGPFMNARNAAAPSALDLYLQPTRNHALPMLAFLLVPAPALDEPNFNGSHGAPPQDRNGGSQGGGANGTPPPGGSGANPSQKPGSDSSGNGSAPQSGEGSQSGKEGSGAGSNSASGSGGAANWSKADRITWQGYEFYLQRVTPFEWRCLAMPVRNEHGGFHYFADQTGVVRHEFGRPASAQSAPI